MILLIDNYDSFVHNLARYFERLGQTVCVSRNDAIDASTIRQAKPQAIVISPGPCTPTEAGCSLEIVRQLGNEFPILGVCLGHQVIAAALGGKIIRAVQPMHGRTSVVTHNQNHLFTGIPNPITVCRYHSLVADESSLPSSLLVTARSNDDEIMAIQHHSLPVYGVQFHPEAILTEYGYEMLANFLRLAQVEGKFRIPDRSTEFDEPTDTRVPLPANPVTF